MRIKYVIIFLIYMLLLIPWPAFAINFVPEDLFNSVTVVYTSKGLGSGFAINKNIIITNAHVVEDFANVSVKLYNDKTCSGKVIKIDKNVDLALVQVDETLTPLKLASEDKVSIGKEVYAIGAPKDIPYTMTKGIISAKNRKVGNHEYIQIDASINSGNSGGPLVDENGEVIGINTMKMVDAEGIGFAIGTSYINDFINGVTPKDSVAEEPDKDNKIIQGDPETNYKNIAAQNEKLKIAVIVLSVLLLIAILTILKLLIKKKRKDKYDFEIEILE
ncbi:MULTISPECIES: trypsin-like peptidase domain-containing protein [unclassified Clostridium]|uniref:S1C family serine protease n=1 Tax=unclassified Clostridium TaxID=2614128 RepID=UPI00029829AC|nr:MULTISPECIES: trypsin-like peptidase domain-containing protein [unclassified Clostridium]EKQ57913.1 MAG: trypsin-like serine protease [Clostridium sp. Maddingley MBC34-26]